MYRDFSEKSKNNLLQIVSQVENEKLSNFTDWIGDRWYDFESWIGKLNIKNYINNVNAYHKKVIDKNNATNASINRIFNKVRLVDARYKVIFFGKKVQLQKWNKYIQELSSIVNPRNGIFDAKYIKNNMERVLKDENENGYTIADLERVINEIIQFYASKTKGIYEFISENIDEQMRELREYSMNKEVLPSLNQYDLANEFLDSRNSKKDAILYGLTRNLLDGVKSLINSSLGQDGMTDTAYKNQIMSIINEAKESDIYVDIGKELLEEYNSKVVDPLNEWNKIAELIENNNEKYKYLEQIDAETFNKIGDLLKYGQEGIEAIEIMFSDYSTTISTLENLKCGLQTVQGNTVIIEYINQLIADYNNKFKMLTDKALSLVVDQGANLTLDWISTACTGGLLSIAEMSQEIIWNNMNLDDKGDALAKIYASGQYSNDLVRAYEFYAEKLRSGNYTEEDYKMCLTMFELAKEIRIQEYENIAMFSTDETVDFIEEEISKLKSLQLNFSI